MNPVQVADGNAVYNSENYLVLDFETTVLSKGSALDDKNRIVLAVSRCGPDHPRRADGGTGGDYQVYWDDEYHLSELVDDCERADFIIAHNAKFELQWLVRAGLDLSKIIVWDTMIGDYVLGGNKYVFWNLSLERCAQRWFKEGKLNIISKLYKAGVCSTEIPASWLESYCIKDVELTERLFLAQRDKMRDELPKLMPIMYHRCLLTPVLADLEKRGMRLDGDLIRIRHKEVTLRLNKLLDELTDMTGGININSGQQLGPYLYEVLGFEELKVKKAGKWVPKRTDTDLYATDQDTIEALVAKNDRQRRFLKLYVEFKSLNNERTKYLEKMLACVEADDVLIAQFNQTNTQTHRLSSSGLKYKMQFQNFPRSYKPYFTAGEEGWLVGEVDGSQLEFRVATHLGRDRQGIEDIANGVDVHSVTADIIGVTRQEAKADTFKPLYGGQKGTPEQQKYYAHFREKYEDITATQKAWCLKVAGQKYLETEWGMRYYWPQCRMEDNGYITHSTSICNYPVQAFATAEIIPAALYFMWHEIKRRGLRMRIVNTVHDSIIVEMPPEEVEVFHELSRLCLIDYIYPYIKRLYGIDLVVPLACGVKVATHWSGSDAEQYVPEGVPHKGGECTYEAPPELWENAEEN